MTDIEKCFSYVFLTVCTPEAGQPALQTACRFVRFIRHLESRRGVGGSRGIIYMRTGIRELALIFKINYLGRGGGGEAKNIEESCIGHVFFVFPIFQGVAGLYRTNFRLEDTPRLSHIHS
jgi:hypothetical protein